MCHYSPTLNFLSSASGGSDIIGTFLTSGEWSVNYEQFGGFCMFCDFKGKGKAKISSSLCLYVCVCFSAFVCRKSISLLEILIRSLSCGLCGGSEEVYNRFITSAGGSGWSALHLRCESLSVRSFNMILIHLAVGFSVCVSISSFLF